MSTSHVGFLCVPPGVRLGWGGIVVVVVLECVWVEEELRR